MPKKHNAKSNALQLFHSAPVPQAVLKNTLPAMAAMLMVLVYNLADTFFIGQTNDDLQVAAVSLATPVFLLFMALGTVFGVGGTSVISRALGQRRPHYAKRVCAFCMWACVIVGVVMSALMLIFMNPLLRLIGASPDTWNLTKTYLVIVTCSGPFVLISNCFSNILRAEGEANRAMFGPVLGNLLNVILDPILILGLDWGITGAAIATVIGMLFSAGYYIVYFMRGKSSLSISPRRATLRQGVCSSVLAIGIPAALGSLLMSISQIVVNAQMAAYDDMALAGIGVAMKVTMITGMVCIGFGQGVQPLLGYCVGARLWPRFKEIMKISIIFALGLSIILTAACYLLRRQIVGAFLTEPASFDYALQFTNILLTTSFLFGVFYVLANALQAIGAASAALVINLSRQGLIYIPALFILQNIMGVTGLVWAQPLADLLSTVLVCLLYCFTLRRLMQTAPTQLKNNKTAALSI